MKHERKSKDNEPVFSKYYKRHKQRLHCPFCGSTMDLVHNIYYERNEDFWYCSICTCTLLDKANYTAEERGRIRKRIKNDLKIQIAKKEEELEFLKRRLTLWGKYMTDREKVKLLAEELEESTN